MAQQKFPHGAPVSFYEIRVQDIEINPVRVKFHPAIICFVAARRRQSLRFQVVNIRHMHIDSY